MHVLTDMTCGFEHHQPPLYREGLRAVGLRREQRALQSLGLGRPYKALGARHVYRPRGAESRRSASYRGSPEQARVAEAAQVQKPLLLLMVSPWGQGPSGRHSDSFSTC